MKAFDAAVVTAGVVYLVVLGWAMQSLSWDIWGVLVVVPVLALISAPLIARAFPDDLEPLRPWVWAGLAVKFAGAIAGYNVRFDAYGGSADAGRYHDAGKLIAGQFHDGTIGIFGLIPSGTNTEFVEDLTGLVYAVFGTSRLGGFMVFTWMSFWGLVFFVKAAHHAIGGFATRRYAIAVFFFPSLVYWGSSIGKEAFVGLCLGLATYGASLVLTRRGGVPRGFVLLAAGLIGAAYVRPHFAAIWAGAILIALFARVVLDLLRRSDRGRTPEQPVGHGPAARRRRHRLPDRLAGHPQLSRPRRRQLDDRWSPSRRSSPTGSRTSSTRSRTTPPRAARRSSRCPSTDRGTGRSPRSAPSPGRCCSRPAGSPPHSRRSR